MKSTIFGCTMLIIATMLYMQSTYIISGIICLVGFIFVGIGAVSKS